ncbi:hypothetical protein GH714_037278 [Hevea brasiliensis]|uniref:SHSP domain-containing protein n=1 Tax=Hevea brasiliensis TaxID=3981 RepID=A0A6A6KDX4_HEVBR|nr:hypothetical protein GH714_037278 [Hevea brasiliensis]
MDLRFLGLEAPLLHSVPEMMDLIDDVEKSNAPGRTWRKEKREEEKEGAKYARMERRVRKFMRRFKLPENVNTDAISAVYQDGVLTVSVEKVPPPEPKKPKTIEVKIA